MASDWVLHPESNRWVRSIYDHSDKHHWLRKWCARSCDSKSNFKVSCSFFWCEKSGEVIRLIKVSRRANEAPPGPRFPIPKMHMSIRPHSSQDQAAMQVA
ncbi:hypothetical protein N7449_003795 [Penicillium cf. viridicatum]|uniref:Uncharacterized protein n=1 Tax=Penicillium cf. viridicatum TaxID=2972119 RepID=A0A9W9MXP4_9EURO|nr:hypothetical protein N7449_003795 [Penicillium cf. viridicatum]